MGTDNDVDLFTGKRHRIQTRDQSLSENESQAAATQALQGAEQKKIIQNATWWTCMPT